jgi:glucose uptake protein
MVSITSYALAVGLCVVTMLCWGSWANTQKLTRRSWPFQLFYWDYAAGVLLLAVLLALTAGSLGSAGRAFLPDLVQGSSRAVRSALLGGIIFNLSNILLVAAIDIAGLAVAFPVGVGLALALGVVTNYLGTPVGNPVLLFAGVAAVVIAIVLDALAYRRLSAKQVRSPGRGIAIAVVAGVLMGLFYRFVAASMSASVFEPEAGQLGPYTAVVVFSVGVFLSTFVWNSIFMVRPLAGRPVAFRDYITAGDTRVHLIGVLGGVIWSLGMALSILASGPAGFAISYGLGQGATLVAAMWGVFVWREFRQAPAGTGVLLTSMFVCYLAGLGLIIVARL